MKNRKDNEGQKKIELTYRHQQFLFINVQKEKKTIFRYASGYAAHTDTFTEQIQLCLKMNSFTYSFSFWRNLAIRNSFVLYPKHFPKVVKDSL